MDSPRQPPDLLPHEERRTILIVLDGVGCGALPDAEAYGDLGSNTLGNLSRRFEDGLRLPQLQALGLGHLTEIRGVPPCSPSGCRGAFGKCRESSAGKDSTTGHWEMAGVILDEPFPTYPDGFPSEVLDSFSKATGRGILGNKTASGTEIIEELGETHLKTGDLIVYTSADSVFQIAAHESVCSEEDLYEICRMARKLLTGRHGVGRVIARPFRGEPGQFVRTSGRHDFSREPPGTTLLDQLVNVGIPTVGIGKIGDLFAHRSLTREVPTASNQEGIDQLIQAMEESSSPSLIFLNLVEFDQVYGHRKDCEGYRAALEAFDAALPRIQSAQGDSDLCIITSDHGVDPTTPGTDHTREHTPLLAWGNRIEGGTNLGTRATYADIGQTVTEYLGAPALKHGRSFLSELTFAANTES